MQVLPLHLLAHLSDALIADFPERRSGKSGERRLIDVDYNPNCVLLTSSGLCVIGNINMHAELFYLHDDL